MKTENLIRIRNCLKCGELYATFYQPEEEAKKHLWCVKCFSRIIELYPKLADEVLYGM